MLSWDRRPTWVRLRKEYNKCNEEEWQTRGGKGKKGEERRV
jgi:hypothetical protein